jgi:hypothetical protein
MFLFFVKSFESSSISETYGEDLVIDEKVHITISKDNETLIVPAKIGIEHDLWKDHSLDYYSSDSNYTSPLHTKNYNGTINIESIHDREFTLENFLDIWGFDKSELKNIFCNEKKCNINSTLTDGQNLILQIKNDEYYNNFSKYVYQRITFEYPSEWNLTNNLTLPSEYLYGMTLRNETFVNLIKVFPKESKYMITPFFSILINKLDSNMTQLDEYYKDNLYKLLIANENIFPHFINYNETKINNGNLLAYQIFLNTTLVAEPGSSAKGNNITQQEFHIWALKDGYFYDISFRAFENVYNNYLPVVDKIIKSIRFH